MKDSSEVTFQEAEQKDKQMKGEENERVSPREQMPALAGVPERAEKTGEEPTSK